MYRGCTLFVVNNGTQFVEFLVLKAHQIFHHSFSSVYFFLICEPVFYICIHICCEYTVIFVPAGYGEFILKLIY